MWDWQYFAHCSSIRAKREEYSTKYCQSHITMLWAPTTDKACLFNQTSMNIHPKFCNINPHNFTRYLISRHPRERRFIVQISLLIITFLSLISRIFSLMQTTREVGSHPRITPCVNMWSITCIFLFFVFFLVTCWMCIIDHGSVLGQPLDTLDTSFGLPQVHDHGSWLNPLHSKICYRGKERDHPSLLHTKR